MISYELEGQGPLLTLVHGVGSHRGIWSRVKPRLRELQLLLPDLRGHGESSVVRSELSLGELAEDIAELLPAPTHLVGFSLGALVAQALTLGHPDRVRSLTLVACVAKRSAEERAAVQARLEAARRSLGEVAELADERWFSEALRERDPEACASAREMLLSTDQASYIACYEIFSRADADLWERLPEIDVPALVVAGADDPASTPRMAHALAEHMRSARVTVFEETRHLIPLERPAELAEAIREHVRQSEERARGARPFFSLGV